MKNWLCKYNQEARKIRERVQVFFLTSSDLQACMLKAKRLFVEEYVRIQAQSGWRASSRAGLQKFF